MCGVALYCGRAGCVSVKMIKPKMPENLLVFRHFWHPRRESNTRLALRSPLLCCKSLSNEVKKSPIISSFFPISE